MSYTNASVLWSPCARQGQGIEDEYGDVNRPSSIVIKARKQPHQDIIKTSDGRELLSKHIFYVDPYVEPNALSIEKMDQLDGETIEHIYDMCDLSNKVRMRRFITV